ncbi:hypothetical protein HA41_18615 [Pantoea conspicua]|uniref:Uncharacterized protein n=1 Tax=Pantoea conspicua TaxID=472705 RepID=A0A1X1BRB9_9GAMM|nr:hypothetical protein [Pantoea conspicua]ORM50657.1 hypothetical protein HA41_18615 [Pantoea conspicua]
MISSGKYNKLARYVFFLGLAVSVIVPLIFYKSFNKIVYAEPAKATADNSNIMFNVDQCEYRNGKLSIRGWATPKEGVGDIMVFVNIDGKTLKLHTGQIKRVDVSTAMNKPGLYDKSGFSASINIEKEAKSIETLIQISKDNHIYLVKHDCK